MAEGPRSFEVSPLVTTTLSATLLAELVLGKVRIGPHSVEPPYLQSIRTILMQYKKSLGTENYDKFIDEFKPALHALAAMLFDEVTGVHLDDTVTRVKALPVPHRVAVEAIAAGMTGKGGDRRERWDNDLYDFKRTLQQVCTLSISNITLEDIRAGYDELLHAVVDKLYEHRKTLVS